MPPPQRALYEQQEHLSSHTITIVYAVYALGIVVSLLLAGHVSDWYGRLGSAPGHRRSTSPSTGSAGNRSSAESPAE